MLESINSQPSRDWFQNHYLWEEMKDQLVEDILWCWGEMEACWRILQD